ncbi:hypothetical protein STEG23_006402, partial [Scotinomys teguina]
MQPGRTTNTGSGTMEVKAAAPRCQLLLILLMSAVMLLPGTNGSLLLVQRTVTRTIVLQETISKGTQRDKKRVTNSLLLVTNGCELTDMGTGKLGPLQE